MTDSDDTPEETSDRADDLAAVGRWADALDLYVRAAASDPTNEWAICEISSMLENLGRLSEALTAANNAVGMFPLSSHPFTNLGNVLTKMDRGVEAIAAYSRAVELDPFAAYCYRNLARAASRVGDFRAANEAMEQGLELEPTVAASFQAAGLVKKRSGDPASAVELYEKGLELHPADAGLHCGLGEATEQLGDFDSAAQSFRNAIQLDPDNNSAVRSLVRVMVYDHAGRGDIEAAKEQVSNFVDYFRTLDRPAAELEVIVDEALKAGQELFANLRQYEAALQLVDQRVRAPRIAATPDTSNTLLECVRSRSKYLSFLDRHTEAISSAEQAVAIARSIAALELVGFEHEIQESLYRLADVLGAAGQLERAVEVAQQCVAECRQLPDNLQRDRHLGWALCLLGQRLEARGASTEALNAIVEATEMRRRVFNQTAVVSDEVRLNEEFIHQAECLLDVGDHTNAFKISEQAVEFFRQYVDSRPLDRGWLDEKLIIHAKALDANNQPEEALTVIREAIASLQQLVKQNVQGHYNPTNLAEAVPDHCQKWLANAVDLEQMIDQRTETHQKATQLE